jgi:hypothetical protein
VGGCLDILRVISRFARTLWISCALPAGSAKGESDVYIFSLLKYEGRRLGAIVNG